MHNLLHSTGGTGTIIKLHCNYMSSVKELQVIHPLKKQPLEKKMFKKNAGRTTRQQSFRADNQTFPNSAVVKGFAMSSLETTLNNWRNPESPRDLLPENLYG